MKKLLSLFSFFLFSFTLFAQPRPKLVVGIVVDQMRWDYLYRYYNHYGSDGFKRLMKDGFNCQQTLINYLPAFTAPGHTCIYTGSVPAIHGIAGNEWIENGKMVYCTDDKTVQPVGGSKIWGQMSPRNLLTTTMTDELRLATNMRSRVFAVSLKDRSSILPGGHLANGAYWFDDSTGNFMTSDYYSSATLTIDSAKYKIGGLGTHKDSDLLTDNLIPRWLMKFNAYRWADTFLRQDWKLRDDAATYKNSFDDESSRYEGAFAKNRNVAFPHLAGDFLGKGAFKYNTIRKIPAGNTLTLKLARACIKANELGTKADPDFLAISLSATDYAGHQFGPNALEMEDMYIRLDEELAKFLRYLDNNVGEGQYTVFLTADHGAAHNSLLLNDLNIPAGNVSEEKLRQELNKYLLPFTGLPQTVRSLDNYQVYLNDTVRDATGTLGIIRNYLVTKPEVQYVFSLIDGKDMATIPEPIRTMAINGFHSGRSGLMQIILKPAYYAGYAPTGTTHGTWNPYDTHIPLLFYGWGIRKGELYREVHMTDIAATISALLHIQQPNGCVGKVIPEVLK